MGVKANSCAMSMLSAFFAMLLCLSSATTALAQSVRDYGEVAALAYHAGDSKNVLPSRFKSILENQGVSIGFGLKALAVEETQSGVIIIGIAGTEFRDPLDVLSSLALTEKEIDRYLESSKLSDAYTFTLSTLRNLDQSIGSMVFGEDISTETVSTLRRDRQALLAEQLQAAEKFVAEVERKTKWFGLFDFGKRYTIVGHSLGGYFAQIIGAKRGWETHTFNAPGAKSFFETPEDVPTSTDITNHIREFDVVGNFGVHLGRVLKYPNADGWLLDLTKNHSIETFVSDFKNRFARVE